MKKLFATILFVLTACTATNAPAISTEEPVVPIQPPAPSAIVDSFESCAQVYPVMESYPRQCATPDGRQFAETFLTPFNSDSAEGAATIDFSDRLVRVTYPASFAIIQNPEENRRGAQVSYNVSNAGPLTELQFFTPESIAACEAREQQGSMCFEGIHPTTESYNMLIEEYGKPIAGYEMMQFGDRPWYVSTFSVSTDIGYSRVYSTVVGVTQIDVVAYLLEDTAANHTFADSYAQQFIVAYTGY